MVEFLKEKNKITLIDLRNKKDNCNLISISEEINYELSGVRNQDIKHR